MPKITVYLVDNTLELIYQNKLNSYKLTNIINQGRIIDADKFKEEFTNILKKLKIKSGLFGDKITCIQESFYTHADIFYLNHIFEDLGFIKVEHLDIKNFFLQNYIYVEINQDYAVINLEDAIFINLQLLPDIMPILNILQIKENIILFGKNKVIPNLQNKDLNIYYLDNYVNFISDTIIKYNQESV